jgi:hypothetical protein
MEKSQNLFLKIGCSFVILIGVLFVLIPISPYNSPCINMLVIQHKLVYN